MEEELKKLIGKKVHIAFESKRHNGIYSLTGKLLRTDASWSLFEDITTDYPPVLCEPTNINTSRIRSVEETA